MVLIIGGYAQGQLNYVRQRYEITDRQVFSACLPDTALDQEESQDTQTGQPIVIQDFNVWLRQEILSVEKDSETLIFEQLQRKLEDLLRRYPNVILISDEVGNGLIPMVREERIVRDLIGRTQVYLTGQADEVIRVICGIGQQIK
ncbi:MAG: bifunctional adenosylcobinamide kinase/adenosylcobinamide-phosphate guanylyltransferase [Lachnospiraceae bacterium]|nr:bifunctional adenosylcobinamide kinase/adenosylcobinamide-phosphate guanylyltransferase [Lachnospiraceae bacterium]MBR1568418.1 bifunctional adenosylcobinamide kinase/adenosylcobinamide-phosphate guanylyltransferase [Lachnospiraceae bacterium]